MKTCAIVLNYFGYEDTLECVESLLEDQSLAEVVIVENSASEEERSRVEARFSKHERVRILSSGRNLGFAGGVNFALTSVGIASFDAFLILNNDTLVPAGTLELLERGLRGGDYGFVAPAIHSYHNTDKIWSNGNTYNRFTGMISNKPLIKFGSLFYLTGCCLLIRSKVFETIGLLDESFFMYGEDVEFCFRVARRGLKYGVVPKARIFHKGSGSSQNNSLFYEYHINRAHLLLCEKLALSPKEARLSRLSKMTVISLRAFWRIFRYDNLNPLRGLRRSIADFVQGGEAVLKSAQ